MALIFTEQKMVSFCTLCWQCTCVQNSKKQDALWSYIKTIPWSKQTTPSIHNTTTLSSDRMSNLVWWQLAKMFGKTLRHRDDALMNLDVLQWWLLRLHWTTHTDTLWCHYAEGRLSVYHWVNCMHDAVWHSMNQFFANGPPCSSLCWLSRSAQKQA